MQFVGSSFVAQDLESDGRALTDPREMPTKTRFAYVFCSSDGGLLHTANEVVEKATIQHLFLDSGASDYSKFEATTEAVRSILKSSSALESTTIRLDLWIDPLSWSVCSTAGQAISRMSE